MKPILRTVLTFLAAALSIAVMILVAAPPRGHAVRLLPAPTPSPIRVYITGAVNTPGLYDLHPGSRLAEAVEAAGGLTGTADAGAINLAEILSDGKKVVIPAVGAAVNNANTDLPERSTPHEVMGQAINLNTAEALELETLPGIGPSLANKIIAYRDAHGAFAAIEELLDVDGIGEAKFEGLRDLVSVD